MGKILASSFPLWLNSVAVRIPNRMARLSLVFLLLSFSTASSQAGDVSVRSERHALTIRLRVPRGWEGATHKSLPSYETWSFSKGVGENISYLQIRIDSQEPAGLDWNLATNAVIKGIFHDFTDPEIERIAQITTDTAEDTPVLVWAAHNVGGELLMAQLPWGQLKISLELRTRRRVELRRLQNNFVDAVRSVRIVPDAWLSPK